MKIIVEKNVPLPSKRNEFHTTLIGMEVGDSFIVDSEAQRATVYITAKKLGLKFIGKRVDGGIRIWKIAPQKSAEAVVNSI